MLKQEKYDSLLKKMGFVVDSNNDKLYIKTYQNHDGYNIYVNFEANKIVYETREDNCVVVSNYTSSNLENPENIVDLECVDRLLEKGYNPSCIELEHSWSSGHGTSGRLDILVRNNEGIPYLMIECKTWGEQYKKEVNNTLQTKKINSELEPKGQLFSYYNQERTVDYLCIYTSTYDSENIKYENSIIQILPEWKTLSNQKEIYDHWNKNYKYNGIFEFDVRPYNIECKALLRKDLQKLTAEDSSKIFHQFLEILRHNSVSDKTNAFNKILNLFICKIVDEDRNENEELLFQWKDDSTYEKTISNMENLYKKGMSKFLGISITDYSDQELEGIIRNLDENSKKSLKKMFEQLRMHKSSEFAFKEVYNEESFKDNAIVVREIVELLQPYQFKYGQKHQFLGNFFELLLNTSIKQEAGQFFTPVPIAKFMISSLPIADCIDAKVQADDREILPNMIDYASGSGHFITEYMDITQKIINNYDTTNMSSSTKNKFERWKKSDGSNGSNGEFEWASEYVYAIEKDYRLVKTTKISTFLNGDGDANILYADGLDKFSSNDYKGKILSNGKNNHNFDFVIANPPYSVSAFKNTLKANDEDFDLYKLLTENSSEIECLFVERTSQLLRENGCAAIILPSSIFTNNSNIYSETRKIILKNFFIKAVASMGSNTFMATGTSTVILLLQKRNQSDYDFITNLVKNFFNNFIDINYLGIKNIFNKYINENIDNINFSKYVDLFKSGCFDKVSEYSYFSKYKTNFEKDKEWKQYTKSSEFRNYDAEIKEKIENKRLIEFIKKNEIEKLVTYLLLAPFKTLIINTGEKQEEKDFLGYYFTERSGQEGIHYYTDDGTETGVLSSKLYSEETLNDDETKANYYIFKSFSNEYPEIDDSLMKNISLVPSNELINFEKSCFDSTISLKPKFNLNIDTRFDNKELGKYCSIQKGTSITENEIIRGNIPVVAGGKNPAYYHNSFNRDQDIITVSASGANSGFVNYWNEKIFASDCTTIKSNDENILRTKYIYAILKIRQDELYSLQKGQGQPHVYPENLSEIKIPLPDIKIQDKIILEFEKSELKEKQLISENIDIIQETEKLEEEIYNSIKSIDKLGRLSVVSGGKRIPKGMGFSKRKTDYPYLRVTDFRNFRINEKTVKYVDKKVYDKISNYTISQNDIYISIAGTLGLVGMVGEEFDNQLLTENAAKITPNSLDPKYLMYVLSLNRIQNTIQNRGVGTPKLSLELIRDIDIPIVDDTGKYVEQFDKLYLKKNSNSNEIIELENYLENYILEELK